jgi:hypothetical protein
MEIEFTCVSLFFFLLFTIVLMQVKLPEGFGGGELLKVDSGERTLYRISAMRTAWLRSSEGIAPAHAGLCLGVVYGPNGNNQEFFRNIEQKLAQWGNKSILGGDFNTILSSQGGDQNLDREGIGRVPNVQNSRIINEWLTNGIVVDPYRALYLENRMVSYIPFRMRNIRADDVS